MHIHADHAFPFGSSVVVIIHGGTSAVTEHLGNKLRLGDDRTSEKAHGVLATQRLGVRRLGVA